MTIATIHGVLLFDKPLGWSSNKAVQTVKRCLRVHKVGHTGTLDPLATGLLPLCIGEATKFGQGLLDADKTYQAVMQLGQVTSTGDKEGEIVSEQAVPAIDQHLLDRLAQQFTGLSQQIPPMYSALKHQGKALYQLARQGQTIERAPRTIVIHQLRLHKLNDTQLHIDVRCSKGTYIRTLAEDIGVVIGCGAHLASLRRTAVGSLPMNAMVGMEQLQQPDQWRSALLPIDSCVQALPCLVLDESQVMRLLWGQMVLLAVPTDVGIYRLYNAQQQFLGVAEVQVDGRLLAKRLINNNAISLC